jgi:hypothetical protein
MSKSYSKGDMRFFFLFGVDSAGGVRMQRTAARSAFPTILLCFCADRKVFTFHEELSKIRPDSEWNQTTP